MVFHRFNLIYEDEEVLEVNDNFEGGWRLCNTKYYRLETEMRVGV